MNFVYKKDSLKPLTPEQIANIANTASPFAPFTANDFDGDNNRVDQLVCDCGGHGEFEFMALKQGEYRYRVRCRLCGVETYL